MLRDIALLVSDEPELAGAVTTALLGKDPDVEHLRLRIAQEINRRLAEAPGPDADPAVVENPEKLLYAGAPRARRDGLRVVSADRRTPRKRSTRMLLS